jgi:hypothetical protein
VTKCPSYSKQCNDAEGLVSCAALIFGSFESLLLFVSKLAVVMWHYILFVLSDLHVCFDLYTPLTLCLKATWVPKSSGSTDFEGEH